MIVTDEQISYDIIIDEIAAWYPGAVFSICDSRPHGVILDPEIPTLWRKLRQPTLVTINYRDFFQRKFLHADYCIVCFKLEPLEAIKIPALLRSVLSLPEYNTKARRMEKIISWRDGALKHLSL